MNSLQRAAESAMAESNTQKVESDKTTTTELCIIASNLVPSNVQHSLSDAKLCNAFNLLSQRDMLVLRNIQPFTFHVRKKDNPLSDPSVRYDAEFYVSNLMKQNSPILNIITDVVAFRCAWCVHTTITRRDLYKHGAAQLYHCTATSDEVVNMMTRLREHMFVCPFVTDEFKSRMLRTEQADDNSTVREMTLKRFFNEWLAKNISYPKSLNVPLGQYHILQKNLQQQRQTLSTSGMSLATNTAAARAAIVSSQQQQQKLQQQQQHHQQQQQHRINSVTAATATAAVLTSHKQIQQQRQHQQQLQLQQQQQQFQTMQHKGIKLANYLTASGGSVSTVSPDGKNGFNRNGNTYSNNTKNQWITGNFQKYQHVLPTRHITYVNANGQTQQQKQQIISLANKQQQLLRTPQNLLQNHQGQQSPPLHFNHQSSVSPHQNHVRPQPKGQDIATKTTATTLYDSSLDIAVARGFSSHLYGLKNTKGRIVVTDLTKIPVPSCSNIVESPYCEKLMQCFEIVEKIDWKEDKEQEATNDRNYQQQTEKPEERENLHQQIPKELENEDERYIEKLKDKANDDNIAKCNTDSIKTSTACEKKKKKRKLSRYLYIQCRFGKNTIDSSYCLNNGSADEIVSYFTTGGGNLHMESNCSNIPKHIKKLLNKLKPKRETKYYKQFVDTIKQLYDKAWNVWFQETYPYLNEDNMGKGNNSCGTKRKTEKDCEQRVKDIELYTPITWKLLEQNNRKRTDDRNIRNSLSHTLNDSILTTRCTIHEIMPSSSITIMNKTAATSYLLKGQSEITSERTMEEQTYNHQLKQFTGLTMGTPIASKPTCYHPNDVIDGLFFGADGLIQSTSFNSYSDAANIKGNKIVRSKSINSSIAPNYSKDYPFHVGNRQFLLLLHEYRSWYLKTSTDQKNVIAHSIISEIQVKRGGKFYKMTNTGTIQKLSQPKILKLVKMSLEEGGFGMLPLANCGSFSNHDWYNSKTVGTEIKNVGNHTQQALDRLRSKSPGCFVMDCEKVNQIGLLHGDLSSSKNKYRYKSFQTAATIDNADNCTKITAVMKSTTDFEDATNKQQNNNSDKVLILDSSSACISTKKNINQESKVLPSSTLPTKRNGENFCITENNNSNTNDHKRIKHCVVTNLTNDNNSKEVVANRFSSV